MPIPLVGQRGPGLRQLADENANSSAFGGELHLRRSDAYWLAGLNRSNALPAFSDGWGFSTVLFAVPEVFPVAGTITSLAIYGSHTGNPDPRWFGLFTDVDAGGANKHYPGNSLYNFLPGDSPSLGGPLSLTEGAVNVTVAAGTVLWFVGQQASNGNFGSLNIANFFRPALGMMTPATISGGESKGGYIGIRTNGAPDYDSALATFPTVDTGLIRTDTNTWAASGANPNIPAMLFKFNPA